MHAVSKEELALDEACRLSFDTFAMRAFSEVEGDAVPYEWNWHIGCIAEHLEAVYRGDLKRLIINVPPRTLKTFLTDVAFPAWVLGLAPHSKFILASYSSGLASDAVTSCKNIMRTEWYMRTFPKSRIDPKHDQAHDFKTTGRGRYYGTGILGTITGKGADYVLVDDPVKPDEALSDTIRNGTNNAIRNTLFSRFNDSRTGRFVMIMQRLHEDDPTGHLMKDGGYTLLKLPAQATTAPVLVTLGEKYWTMKRGDYLFPKRLTPQVLEDKRRDMLDYNFVGQYLQEPVPLGGGEFIDTWINYYDKSAIRVKEMNIYILCDPAGGEQLQKKKKKKSDYTTLMVVGLHTDGNYYMLDMVRDRFNPTERVNKLFEMHRTWNGLAGKPAKVGYERYGMMSDTHYIHQQQNREGYRFPLHELGGTMGKEERIRRMIPDLQGGRWWFPATLMYTDCHGRTMDMVHELINSEMATFPRARYDDMLDAITRIYDNDFQAVFPRIKKRRNQTATEYTDWTDY